uniref:Uncharacterized protein n=1 Tax=Arundo donax TaxID=35708 RepID=A0A0A9EIH2_ARUDO
MDDLISKTNISTRTIFIHLMISFLLMNGVFFGIAVSNSF